MFHQAVYRGIFTVFYSFFKAVLLWSYGSGNVVGIATGYALDGPVIESRWGAKFSAPVQTGFGAYRASLKMGTGSFPGVDVAGAWG